MTNVAPPDADAPEAGRRLYSLTGTAAIFGVHRNTISKWIADGAPVVTRADRARGAEWEIDVPALVKWCVARAVADAVDGLVDGTGRTTKDEADRRRAVANATIAEVEADDALKSVVSRTDAEGAMADFCGAIRSALSSVGASIAARTAPMRDPTAIRDVCEAEINRAFQVAESDLTAKWSNVPDPGEA